MKFKKYLSKHGKDKYIVKLADSTATSESAADALSVDVGQIAKTISLLKKEEEACILVVMSGNKKNRQ